MYEYHNNRIKNVKLEQIVAEEVIVYMEAGAGAMGDAGAIEFYSIHDNEVFYFYGNTVRDDELNFDEVCRHLPDGLWYTEGGRFHSDRTKWMIFGGGMGNQFLIRSQYYHELEKLCEHAPHGYYRDSIPLVELFLLELASGARNMQDGKGGSVFGADALFVETLKNRFLDNKTRHPNIEWETVEQHLCDKPQKLAILRRMEESGGEPDVIGFSDDGESLIFCDCYSDAPFLRLRLCYDNEALNTRTHRPASGSVEQQAKEIGVSLLTEELYRRLHEHTDNNHYDSSWIQTPEEVREKGNALFCEWRYGIVFMYYCRASRAHQSRGWRGYILV